MEKKQHSVDGAPTIASRLKILAVIAIAVAEVFSMTDVSLGASIRSDSRHIAIAGDVFSRSRTSLIRPAAIDQRHNLSDDSGYNKYENILQGQLDQRRSMASDQRETLRNRMNRWPNLFQQEQAPYKNRLGAFKKRSGLIDAGESNGDESVPRRNPERRRSMASDQRETLRNRINRWPNLFTQEQSTYNSRLAANEQRNNRTDDSESNEDESALQRNLERWRSMPSDQKETLRNRMDQWQDLSPQEQTTYKKRYQKLQELPPTQRNQIKQSLENWDSLSQDEKKSIQNLFEDQ